MNLNLILNDLREELEPLYFECYPFKVIYLILFRNFVKTVRDRSQNNDHAFF